MNKRLEQKVSFITAATLAFMVAVLLVCMVTEAKTPRNGRTRDAQGNIYIYKHGKLQTGWFKYHGKTYYGHKTKSACYPKGSVARNTYRVRNGRMYYLTDTGAKLTKDSRYIGLYKHHTSVHYIYAPGMGGRRYRYNAGHRRYQYLQDNGKWTDTGNQCWPWGMIDWQY